MAVTDAAKFLVNNYIDRSTTTFSSPQVIQAPLGNLQRFDWRVVARVASTGSAQFIIDLGSALPVSAFAFKGSNLQTGGDILLQYGSIDNGGLFDTNATQIFVLNPTLFPNGLQFHYAHGAFFDPPISKRYWRLDCDNLVNLDNTISLGRIYLGPYLELTRADGTPLHVAMSSPHRIVDPTAVERSPAGSPHADRQAGWTEFSFDLLYMNEEDAYGVQQLYEIQRQFGRSVPIWFFPYPTIPLLRERTAIYGLFQTFADLQPVMPAVFNASQITLSEV